MNKVELVKAHLLQMLSEGSIKEGRRIPGCREISKKLSVNKITVNKACKALEDAHILYCVPRGGFYYAGTGDAEGHPLPAGIDFHTLKPDPSVIPYRAFTHAMNRSIEKYKKNLFDYETALGLNDLRETLKIRLEQDGIYTSSSQILVTHGAQQGIYLALKALFPAPSKDKLLVEVPTYSCALEIAKDLNIECLGIPREAQGINLTQLEELFKKHPVKAFYIIPRHHNPTGYSLQEKDKKRLVELCRCYRVVLIEDDYLADLGGNKRSLPLYYYDTERLSVYIRSFSKVFIPGIRLGAMVMPASLQDAIIRQKYLMDISTSNIPQGALDFFIKSGMYDQHIKKINSCYKRKMLKARSILNQLCFEGLSVHVPKQGLFIWLMPPDGLSADKICKELAKKNIHVCTISNAYLTDSKKKGLRLCISAVPEKDMDALCSVVDTIKALLHQPFTS